MPVPPNSESLIDTTEEDMIKATLYYEKLNRLMGKKYPRWEEKV